MHKVNYLLEGLTLKLNLQKNKVMGPFCTPYSVCLIFAFDRAVLYGNVALSVLVLSTKAVLTFLKKSFSFCRKRASKLKYWKDSVLRGPSSLPLKFQPLSPKFRSPPRQNIFWYLLKFRYPFDLIFFLAPRNDWYFKSLC